MDERELEEGASGGSYHHEVVDLAGVRVARGWRRRDAPKCDHKHLVWSKQDRRIECDDCGKPVDPFDAFEVLTRHFTEMQTQARRDAATAAEAKSAVVHRRAAKELERAWHRGAPCCPHCGNGLLPEDFAGGAAATHGRDYEIARRKRLGPVGIQTRINAPRYEAALRQIADGHSDPSSLAAAVLGDGGEAVQRGAPSNNGLNQKDGSE